MVHCLGWFRLYGFRGFAFTVSGLVSTPLIPSAVNLGLLSARLQSLLAEGLCLAICKPSGSPRFEYQGRLSAVQSGSEIDEKIETIRITNCLCVGGLLSHPHTSKWTLLSNRGKTSGQACFGHPQSGARPPPSCACPDVRVQDLGLSGAYVNGEFDTCKVVPIQSGTMVSMSNSFIPYPEIAQYNPSYKPTIPHIPLYNPI